MPKNIIIWRLGTLLFWHIKSLIEFVNRVFRFIAPAKHLVEGKHLLCNRFACSSLHAKTHNISLLTNFCRCHGSVPLSFTYSELIQKLWIIWQDSLHGGSARPKASTYIGQKERNIHIHAWTGIRTCDPVIWADLKRQCYCDHHFM
jgi:hypothetical protein